MKIRRLVKAGMSDSAEILKLRVLLTLYQMDDESRTVMNISRMLGEEHYAISRIISGYEKEGYVERKMPRKLQLTEKGITQAKKYSQRMELTLNHLLYEGVSMENARNNAYHWALNNTDETMAVIANAEVKYRVKYELRDRKRFTGNEFCKKMHDGTYRFPFIIYKEQMGKNQNSNISSKMFKVNNHAISKNTYNIRMKYSRGQQIKNEFSLISYNGMTGVITTLISDNDICVFRKKINDAALAFVTPVSTCYRSKHNKFPPL